MNGLLRVICMEELAGGGNLLSVRAGRIRPGRNEISVDTSLRGRELFARVVRL